MICVDLSTIRNSLIIYSWCSNIFPTRQRSFRFSLKSVISKQLSVHRFCKLIIGNIFVSKRFLNNLLFIIGHILVIIANAFAKKTQECLKLA